MQTIVALLALEKENGRRRALVSVVGFNYQAGAALVSAE
jgi:hypothetical protein